MTDSKYANTAQQRVLLTLHLLAKHPEGVFPAEIARVLDTLASNTTRDLANLRLAGLAVAVDGRWRCSRKLILALSQHVPN